MDINPTECAFVLEVIDPRTNRRIVELFFTADGQGVEGSTTGEPGMVPQWIEMDQLPSLKLRPPIAGYLAALARGDRRTAAYLGDLWRSDEWASWTTEPWKWFETE